MRVDIKRIKNCCLCGSDHLELVMKLPPSPVADHYVTAEGLHEEQLTFPLDLELCQSCGQVQLSHVVNPDNIYGSYLYTTTTSVGLPDHFEKYAEEILQEINPPLGALVVDIGSNDGTLLKAFKNKGMRVLGVDPANAAAAKAMEKGVETITGYFDKDIASEIISKHGFADIVTANNVLANVECLQPLVESIRDLLSPNGIFVFETGYLLDIVKNALFDTIYHEHLFYFSVKPLRIFFERLGLELIHAEPITTKGGSLRGYVQRKGGVRVKASSVEEMETSERNYGIHSKEVFQNYAVEIEKFKNDLIELIDSLKMQDKTIAGYGASHSVTTLIYAFDLGKRIDYIVDDNPLKQNTFSPGFHIPVLSPAVISERKPDYLVILPWRYVDSIVKRNADYLAQGGKFIVPIPELKVISKETSV